MQKAALSLPDCNNLKYIQSFYSAFVSKDNAPNLLCQPDCPETFEMLGCKPKNESSARASVPMSRLSPLLKKVTIGPQRGGKMTSGESLGATGGKRLRTVDCGIPFKRPISSSGRQLVEIMRTMTADWRSG
ncbi:jg20305 [Pararge aegeria aegeria]|uniref:Jg20305 protein n=1 Tax=Pararge aegeria aegeria TaxID=348720 RepID=A0A8S4RI24_9NEOP|nr:jg20305 [Pararge aegeria aegeria]